MNTNSTDPIPDEENPRKKRIEELLLLIGGCESVIRNNRTGEFGAHPPLARLCRDYQKNYIKRLERVVNGLPEEDNEG